MAEISSDVIRGYNDIIILYLLLSKPSYGYEISKQIRVLSEEKYIIKETTLYSAFTRMEKNGFIESFVDEDIDQKPIAGSIYQHSLQASIELKRKTGLSKPMRPYAGYSLS